MSTTINKILYANDLSPNSSDVFHSAVNTAKAGDASGITLSDLNDFHKTVRGHWLMPYRPKVI